MTDARKVSQDDPARPRFISCLPGSTLGSWRLYRIPPPICIDSGCGVGVFGPKVKPLLFTALGVAVFLYNTQALISVAKE